MDDTAIQSLLDKLKSDPLLRRKLVEALQPGEDPPGDYYSQPSNSVGNLETHETLSYLKFSPQWPKGTIQRTWWPRGTTLTWRPRVTNLGRWQTDTNMTRWLIGTNLTRWPRDTTKINSQWERVHKEARRITLSNFDPDSLASGDDYLFDAPQIINDYVEKYFRAKLRKEVREAMYKAHPIPDTPVMRVPKVDNFAHHHLQSRFPTASEN